MMLDYFLKANLIEFLDYCKYHRLINHSIKKCFVLKDKIMRLHENDEIVFYEKKSFTNAMTMVHTNDSLQ
jgi:hypothetical protein